MDRSDLIDRLRAAWLTLAAVLATAAAPGPALEEELTGGSSRAWMQRSEPEMAACGLPDSFTFVTTHRLAISRCVHGRSVTSVHNWRVAVKDQETWLFIDGIGSYVVTTTSPVPGARRILLRALTADRAGVPVELRSPQD